MAMSSFVVVREWYEDLDHIFGPFNTGEEAKAYADALPPKRVYGGLVKDSTLYALTVYEITK